MEARPRHLRLLESLAGRHGHWHDLLRHHWHLLLKLWADDRLSDHLILRVDCKITPMLALASPAVDPSILGQVFQLALAKGHAIVVSYWLLILPKVDG